MHVWKIVWKCVIAFWKLSAEVFNNKIPYSKVYTVPYEERILYEKQ